ncbi:MAG: glycosyltransferase [Spirochaetes bacterium]|nr:glycosyltransferase [Spirochaetota bacterium]
MKTTRIAAVVVTYNRRALLLQCLRALVAQSYPPDGIYIIDNGSSDDTVLHLIRHGFISTGPGKSQALFRSHTRIGAGTTKLQEIDLYYIRFPENRGATCGFSEGMKYACASVYDWIWLMDDDSYPDKDALRMLAPFLSRPDTAAFASAVKGPDGALSLVHRGMLHYKHIFPRIQTPLEEHRYQHGPVSIDSASFVGLLVRVESIQEAGYPKNDFFLTNDDIEYCIRLSKAGKILLVPASIMYHEEAIKKNCKSVCIFGKIVCLPPYDELWLKYYGFRNLAWIGKRYIRSRFALYMELFFYWLVQIILILLYDKKKLKRFRFYTNALRDGLKGVFDNEKPKRILYD